MAYLHRVLIFATAVFSCAGEICEESLCKFDFVVHRRQTMTYNDGDASYAVELNGTDLVAIANDFKLAANDDFIGSVVDKSDVISADGFVRDVIVVNGQFPAPTIEVMEGAEVVVRVTNHLSVDTLTLHWHGMHQRGTNFMDGTAYITQCPIQPLQQFTYRFLADPPGTHWYHSHVSNQRMDGLFGMLIVHASKLSIPNMGIVITDWYHKSAAEIDNSNPYGIRYRGTADLFQFVHKRDYSYDNIELTPLAYVSTLVSGRGRWTDKPYPLEEYIVPSGRRIRFRLVNAAAEVAYEVHVDDHDLEVVASDGHEISPIQVTSFMVFPGESVDFEVRTDQTPDKYWLRVQSIRAGAGHLPEQDGIIREGLAIMRYDSVAGDKEDPLSGRRNCSISTPCTVFNCPFQDYAPSLHRRCIHVSEARSLLSTHHLRHTYGLAADDSEVLELFFNFGFVVGSSINARKHVSARTPLIQGSAGENTDDVSECDEESCRGGCKCHHLMTLPYNRTIQLVLTSMEPASLYLSHHPIHLHGHSMAVLATGYPQYNRTSGFWQTPNRDVLCNNDLCNEARWNGRVPKMNLDDPPLKDTVVVPAHGYVVVRIRSDNPGYWAFHCHQEMHLSEGMSMVLNEAPGLHAPLPPHFPTCGDFDMSSEEFESYVRERHVVATSPLSRTTSSSGVSTTLTNQGQDRNMLLVESDGTVVMKFGSAVGTAIGFLLLGSILTFLPFVIALCCFRSKHTASSNFTVG